MKRSTTIITIFLNVFFCFITLWFFSRNAILRPYAGVFREILSGIILLGALYFNYFVLYPKIYQKYSHFIYWLVLSLLAVVTGIIDILIAYPSIMTCNAAIIQIVGFYKFFYEILIFIVGRNLALNLFPFLFRDRKHFQQSLEKEVKVVYKNTRKLDVTDKDSNIHLIPINDIFYCNQQRNFTEIYTVKNTKYTRLGSMKHLEQLFGDDFIRITTTVLVPIQYVKSCKSHMVIMKKMPWEKEPTLFILEPKSQEETAKMVLESILKYRTSEKNVNISKKPAHSKSKRKPTIPPEEKVKQVLLYINSHSNCNSGEIAAETKFSVSTVERCLYKLKKDGLIVYTGSKKNGGYTVVHVETELQSSLSGESPMQTH